MAQLNIQIPDELADRLEPLHSCLPELLWLLLDNEPQQTREPSPIDTATGEIPAVYQEVLDFTVAKTKPRSCNGVFAIAPRTR
ncbi:MAG TPA: hypothetical protein VE956_02830 [Nodularia sp. (in: cyanobacteria)]|nr:hypothetical protein [Nodularia sp. (in: cyanobacteria)]